MLIVGDVLVLLVELGLSRVDILARVLFLHRRIWIGIILLLLDAVFVLKVVDLFLIVREFGAQVGKFLAIVALILFRAGVFVLGSSGAALIALIGRCGIGGLPRADHADLALHGADIVVGIDLCGLRLGLLFGLGFARGIGHGILRTGILGCGEARATDEGERRAEKNEVTFYHDQKTAFPGQTAAPDTKWRTHCGLVLV